MSSPRWVQDLRSIGLAFWLLLPTLGILFWLGAGLLTERVLSRSVKALDPLQADIPFMQIQLPITVGSIKADIDKRKGLTRVEVVPLESAVKKIKLELSTTEFSQVESQIAQELGLSIENVRKLVRYQVKN